MTEENLQQQGYTRWHELLLFPGRPYKRGRATMAAFKENARGVFAGLIVGCIGDQDFDVTGAHVGERQWKLPEPPVHSASCCLM